MNVMNNTIFYYYYLFFLAYFYQFLALCNFCKNKSIKLVFIKDQIIYSQTKPFFIIISDMLQNNSSTCIFSNTEIYMYQYPICFANYYPIYFVITLESFKSILFATKNLAIFEKSEQFCLTSSTCCAIYLNESTLVQS